MMQFLKNWTAGTILFLILLGSLGFMLYSSLQESGTMDELAHIPAGYGYVRFLDYRLNPEHPPLIKALSALPLLFFNLNFPENHPAWTTDINGQWETGNQFLYFSGNNADKIIHWARLAPILITLLLVLLIYIFAKSLIGPFWALLPAFLFAFSPNVLAHGHYVTTDIGAAFGIMLSTYFFIRYLKMQTRRELWLAGLTFGIAQALKFSAVLLIPFLPFIAFFYFISRDSHFFISIWKAIKIFFFTALIGYVFIIYPLYFAFTLNYPMERQTKETEIILGSFAGGPTLPGKTCAPTRCLADATIALSKNSITRPFSYYALGVLMVIQRAAGGNTSYFLGEVSSAGSRAYFPVVYALKETLPVLLLTVFAFLLGLISLIKNIFAPTKNYFQIIWNRFKDYLNFHFEQFAMFSFIVLYTTYSVRSPLNIGFRHLFPIFPFAYILVASSIKNFVNYRVLEGESFWQLVFSWFKAKFSTLLKIVLLIIFVLWAFLETVFAAPYFLSYFNELGGGKMAGYRYVTDSNYDWGQDLKRLQKFVETHPEIDRIGVDYFGAGNPKYYLGDKEENWQSSRGNPADQNIHWLAISVNTLQSAIEPTAPGFDRNPADSYLWLQELRPRHPGMGNVPEPDYRIGTSIFVYKL